MEKAAQKWAVFFYEIGFIVFINVIRGYLFQN